MKTHIVRIGNSQGVRIPEAAPGGDGLRRRGRDHRRGRFPDNSPRQNASDGWALAFQAMAQRGDDALWDEVAPTMSAWDEEEWEWR